MPNQETPITDELDINSILISVLVIIITLVIFLLYRRSRTSRNGILLTGLCDSGKTLIYTQLLHERFVQTQTSIKENISDYIVNNKTLKLIDIPGHERLRDKFLEQYKSSTKAIIFVIDSLTVQQDVRDTAEYLYNILVDPIISNNSTKILILCNKQDLTLSKGCNAVKSILEKELNTLRITKSRQLESVDPKVKKLANLGNANDKDFTFNSLHLSVDFGESCAFNKNGDINLNDLKQWLSKVA